MSMIVEAGLLRVDTLIQLYREYANDLRRVRREQWELLSQRPLRPKLDDIEAELSYLLIRARRPATVVEIGSFHGWSTTWLLQALRDNGTGELHTYDLVDHAVRTVPAELAEDRWHFASGDVRRAELPAGAGFVLVDAAHTSRFARWYTSRLFPGLDPGTVVGVHDVFHGRRPWPHSEGAVLLKWLRQRGIGHITASAHGDADLHDRLRDLKRKLRLAAPVHRGRHNPMLFFENVRVTGS